MVERTRVNRRDDSSSSCANAGPTTKKILRNLALMLPTFYMMLYSVSSITYAIFGKKFVPKAPFNFKLCCLEGSDKQVTGTSILMTYFLSTFAFLLISTSRLWDHVITITIIHSLVTAAVNVEFPLNWQWWVTLLIGAVIMIVTGEPLAYCIRKRRQKNVRRDSNRSSEVAT
eukprot:Seg3760.2 transcript_id=Seg3760.2/GoldUCD/mRNA.D3Y31 product="Transmembrane protein 244" protein_id=Seg3760.2/GoldUCD/D3Y31